MDPFSEVLKSREIHNEKPCKLLMETCLPVRCKQVAVSLQAGDISTFGRIISSNLLSHRGQMALVDTLAATLDYFPKLDCQILGNS